MKSRTACFCLQTLLLLVVLAPVASPTHAQDTPLFTQDFTPEEFASRRDRVFDAIGPQGVALVQGEPSPRGYTRFRQSNEFYYLTGIEVPHAYVLMDGASRSTTLYLPHRDERRERGEGKMLSAEDAALVTELSGIERISGPEAMTSTLSSYKRRGSPPVIYTLFQPAEGVAESRDLGIRRVSDRLADAWDGRPSREAHFIGLLRSRLPELELRSLNPILDDLRLIKSPAEIVLIRRATELSSLAIQEAMRSLQPGVEERELDALAKFIYFRHGAQGDAYYSLVASGPNAPFPHYHAGTRTAQAGEWLLMDYAPDFGYYMSDVTRMLPVSGTFSPEQRELYGFYLTAYRAILYRIRPGVTGSQIKEEAVAEMRSTLEATAFSKPRYAEAARNFVEGYARGVSSGRLGHGVGMATHDVGTFQGPLREGMVFTIEPALRVPEENIYIRLEDLIVIHGDHAEVISDFLPSGMDEIEAVMAEMGILQRYPKIVPLSSR
jgi:Xaa-Pro aminopeptidase